MTPILILCPCTLETSDNLDSEKKALVVELVVLSYTLHLLELWSYSVSYWYMQTWFSLKIESLEHLATKFWVTQHAANGYDLLFISSTENEDNRMAKWLAQKQIILTRFCPLTGKLARCQNLVGPLLRSICSQLSVSNQGARLWESVWSSTTWTSPHTVLLHLLVSLRLWEIWAASCARMWVDAVITANFWLEICVPLWSEHICYLYSAPCYIVLLVQISCQVDFGLAQMTLTV